MLEGLYGLYFAFVGRWLLQTQALQELPNEFSASKQHKRESA